MWLWFLKLNDLLPGSPLSGFKVTEELLSDCQQKGFRIFSEMLRFLPGPLPSQARLFLVFFAQYALCPQHLILELCSSVVLRDSHVFRVMSYKP